MPDLVSIGECMVELTSSDALALTASFRKSFGGDTLNLAVMAARLGTRAGYVTRVGDDPFGEYLINSWAAEGIDTSAVRRVDGYNGLYLMSDQKAGAREVVYYRQGSAASTLSPADLPQDYIRSSRITHLSGVTQAISDSARAAALEAARMAKAAGAQVSYDINYRPKLWSGKTAREALEEILPFIDVMMPSVPEDTGPLLGLEAEEEVAEYFRSRGVGIAVVKAGARGAVVAWRGGVQRIAALRGEVVDATGAGDAFGGAFLHALLQGLEPDRAATVAVAVAGLAVRRPGAVTGLPSRREIDSALGGSVWVP